MAPRADQPRLALSAPLPQAPLDDAQRLACLRLARSENVGPATFRELINHCGGASAALAALPELSRRGGRQRQVRIFPQGEAEAELERAHRAGARILFTIEPGYPAALAHVELPPPYIYAKGDIGLLARPAVAIVGSRDASAGGLAMARRLAVDLSRAGLAIISGLARGVDAAAHRASLDGGTIAVVAGGIDIVYPPEHAELQAEIGRVGCIVSEMAMGFQPRGRDFPRRNRIISGISRGVIVVEAAQRSGTLITARNAGEQGREVFAVPGHPLDPRAVGTNALLKDGAILVTEAADVINALARGLEEPFIHFPGALESTQPASSATTHLANGVPAGPVAAPPTPASGTVIGERIAATLGPAPIGIDELARATGYSIREIQIALIELTLAGRVERHGGTLVSLRPPPPA